MDRETVPAKTVARVVAVALAVLALALVLAAPTPAATTRPPKWVQTAIRQLARLPVRAPLSMSGYSRDAFGEAWADVDHNGCDTRNDILRRDLTQVVMKAHSTCIVASGSLHDPYTGTTIHFLRGPTSSAVQIDHVVPLADAWRTGAATWPAARRVRYANDPYLLLAVDGPANEAKGDSDASEWLPTPAYRCRYVAKQVAVKTRYKLWVTKPEHDTISATLKHCP